MNSIENRIEADRRFLELLSQSFPNVAAASTEIINLEAILNLPKGTEHFMADIHGEYEAFLHILKNASGNIKRKVRELFADTLSAEELRELCTLIYYPEQKLEIIKTQLNDDSGVMNEENKKHSSLESFYSTTLQQLIRVCQSVSSKYTRSKVRKALPPEFAYIIEELLHELPSDDDKQEYFARIIQTIVETDRADAFIIALADVIQRLAVDQLHILGDIFDRGPGAHIIMDRLCQHHSFDIQWGNHDALWMGAAAGNDCCIANVLRLSLRYGNMVTLEDGYGINLVPLATFAMETYATDPCDLFGPRLDKDDTTHNEKTRRLIAQMHKAISIIQFKLEAQMILRRPEWQMQDRLVLQNIDKERGVYVLNGKEYEMTDTFFPTLDPSHPFELTPEEADLVHQLHHSFRVSDKLQKHIKCLFTHGCMYSIYNGNLLFHASVPLNADGTLKEVDLNGQRYSGRELLHRIGMTMRAAFNADTSRPEKQFAKDYFWYLWCGKDSPLFDKDRMATFERYFLRDKKTHEEKKGYYYLLRDQPEVVDRILDAFGVEGSHRHIINGHVPVRVTGGESPVKADGKLMVIDGGLSKAYHETTGIAGYTLVFHSRGFELIQHEPFESADDAIRRGTDIVSSKQIVELSGRRLRVRDTDKGKELQHQIDELKELLYAYRHGIIKERARK
ncbi:MAG: fructose-1,6-bisphosphatase [Bacteroidaceae bacterium]|nr:fructose-1,6-bisphosphatase [Bacteroidaceae bacterium]